MFGYYIYICVYMCIYVYIYIHLHIYESLYVCIDFNVHIFVEAHVYTYIHPSVYRIYPFILLLLFPILLVWFTLKPGDVILTIKYHTTVHHLPYIMHYFTRYFPPHVIHHFPYFLLWIIYKVLLATYHCPFYPLHTVYMTL